MSKQEEREAQRSYSVPDTRDVPKRWADGPNAGKLVHKTPMKVRSLKLDPVEAEARAEASRLAKLGKLGKLEIEARHAMQVAELKQAAYEVAYSYQENPWLRREVVPPSRWPIYVLVVVLALLVTLQAANLWRAQHPTLRAEDATKAAPGTGEVVKAEELRKGRAR
jgi:hypothetical protein